MQVIKICTDNTVSVIDLKDLSNQELEKAIDAECIEVVKTTTMQRLFYDDLCLIVDESGLINAKHYNPLASFFYRNTICGDVILCRYYGPEIFPLENADLVKFFLKDHFDFIHEA